MAYQKEYQQKKEEIEAWLKEAAELKDVPEPLAGAMKYSLLDGGKRVRPVIFAEVFRAFGGIITKEVKNFACAIECVHIYSLIHDDLPCMDDDDFRRGKPTNHKVYGEAIAVLAGDALLTFAFELMLDAIELSGFDPRFIRAASLFSRLTGAKGLIGGQILDVHNQDGIMTGQKLEYIFTHKTTDLITASAVMGAVLAGAKENEVQLVKEFAFNFGFAFQIRDDILDYEENKEFSACDYVALNGIVNAKTALNEYSSKAENALSKLKTDVSFLKNLVTESLSRKI